MRRARSWSAAVPFALAALAACSGGSSDAGAYRLAARGGTYQDGSGRVGLAVLATLRDASGAGPAAPGTAAVSDGAGPLADGVYPAGGAGSYAAWWWPEVAVRDGERYALQVTGESLSVRGGLSVSTAGGLTLPEPVLSGDASSITWPAVPGAASYACRVYAAGVPQLELAVHEPACDLSALPPGAYVASVLAFTADLLALAASGAQEPPLPARFDVSEARLGFVRPDAAAPAVTLSAAGGAFDFGTSTRGLAIWVAIAAADGTPTDLPWDVTVVGPQLPASAPVAFTYPARFPRQMVWSYDIPAIPGAYALTATAGALALSTTFTVGDPAPLPFVLDAAAAPAGAGGASVSWTPVAGARAYLVEVWDSATGAPAASQWVAEPPARLPDGSFTPGVTYDVYVAATDADMSGGAVPTGFAVSEYPYVAASFTAASR
ncbi:MULTISPECIES: hypothetical protein [Anaeromyxobacter]|uniref:hypothetical protein n=1 Tax=Anaeromyxobacter TaxID=161492 RepID=UPI001F576E6F|nr:MULTISPECIES: hypothetical protein [unclassified Anaeromyxobacter]